MTKNNMANTKKTKKGFFIPARLAEGRIGLSPTPTNRTFLVCLARRDGLSLSQVINPIIDEFRRRHPEEVARAEEMRALLEAEEDRQGDDQG